jgi:hypothetical protein
MLHYQGGRKGWPGVWFLESMILLLVIAASAVWLVYEAHTAPLLKERDDDISHLN